MSRHRKPKSIAKMDAVELRAFIGQLQTRIGQQDRLITVQQSKIIALQEGVHHSAVPLADLCKRIEEWRNAP